MNFKPVGTYGLSGYALQKIFYPLLLEMLQYRLWCHDQLGVIYAPSRSTCEKLVARGIRALKVKVYPPRGGIDVYQFHPQKRSVTPSRAD